MINRRKKRSRRRKKTHGPRAVLRRKRRRRKKRKMRVRKRKRKWRKVGEFFNESGIVCNPKWTRSPEPLWYLDLNTTCGHQTSQGATGATSIWD